MSASNNAENDRVEKAAAGIESDVVNLTERLQSKGEEVIEHELRLLEALLFAAVEPIDTETLRELSLIHI